MHGRQRDPTGDLPSHVAFTGALGAIVLGYDLRLGRFAAAIGAALLLGPSAAGAGRTT
jgi:zinc/manganese transport system permease protein